VDWGLRGASGSQRRGAVDAGRGEPAVGEWWGEGWGERARAILGWTYSGPIHVVLRPAGLDVLNENSWCLVGVLTAMLILLILLDDSISCGQRLLAHNI
jgi:hypothetical protein